MLHVSCCTFALLLFLEGLRAERNHLSGPIPNGVACWTSVTDLNLMANALSGS